MAPDNSETAARDIHPTGTKSNRVISYEPGTGTGDVIYVTADGRRWKPCDNGTQASEVRRHVNGYMI